MLVDKIKLLCTRNNITIKDLEAVIGLGNGAIGKWSKSCPKTDTLSKVADYFNVSIDYLLGREASTNTEELIDEAMAMYKELPEDKQEQVKAFIKFQASQK